MKRVQPRYTSSIANAIRDTSDPAGSLPYRDASYAELVQTVARIANVNYSQMLFFRGQTIDHKNKAGKSSLYPEIYRGNPLSRAEAADRFEVLDVASNRLPNAMSVEMEHNREDLRRRKFVRWAILQHYDVCATPFLDLTHSLHVACSFATHGNREKFGYVYVLGLPFASSRIAMDAEEELVNVRLLSICPPEALRPHFQEGYVAATLDLTDDYDDKSELDFNRRLIIKFQIPMKKSFWGEDFGPVPEDHLFPDDQDQVLNAIADITEIAERMARPGDIGRFVQLWSILESTLRERGQTNDKYSSRLSSAVDAMYKAGALDRDRVNRIENLRTFRNGVVHRTSEIPAGDLRKRLADLESILYSLDIPYPPSA